MKRWLDHDRFAVYGLGRSGRAAANLLARHGKRVLASDRRAEIDLAGLDAGVDVELGGNVAGDAEVVVVSPGLRPSLDVFRAIGSDVEVISEIELAWEAAEAPMVGITGTDGKTTTTALTAHMLTEGGVETVAAGNIGTPLCEVVESVGAEGVIVAEVSAFQLWTTHRFRVRAGAFTNIAEDHLDYFDDFDDYVAAKRQLVANCVAGDLGVFNADDPVVRRWAAAFPHRRALYSVRGRPEDRAEIAAWYDDAGRYVAMVEEGEETVYLDCGRLDAAGLRGPHNYANTMAAAALARSRGVDWEAIAAATSSFEPLPHRMQFVTEIDGVSFYDDSKATNAHAALAGLGSIPGRLVVIAGGVDKGLDLGEFSATLAARCDAVVLIGELRDRLRASLEVSGLDAARVTMAETLEEAVEDARTRAADAGATVVLSPACSSFDMFDSYAHRGEVFQRAVRALEAD